MAIAVAGCRGRGDVSTREIADNATSNAPYRGVLLSAPLARPAVTLTNTEGKPYDFRSETAGRPTLLFFGYTNCPNVCPVHVANIASAMKRLSYDERRRMRVVFVTTDPARDTPAAIRTWLDQFDRSFVGLTGPQATIDSVQRALGLAPAVIEKPTTQLASDSSYAVGHAAQVLAFASNDTAYLAYPFGTRQADWARDIPRLLSDSTGAAVLRRGAREGSR